MLVGVLLIACLLLAPPVQGWIVKRLIATQPGWRLDFQKLGISPGGVEALGLDFSMPGVSAKSEPIAVRIAPLRLLSQRELRIEHVEAQKLNLIITPAQLASSSSSSTPFEGALSLLQSPLSWAIDTVQINGQITVDDAGESLVIGEFHVQGGGLSAGQPGTFTYDLSVNSAVLPLGPDNKIHSTGTMQLTQTKDNGIARVVIEGEVTLPHYGPLVLPVGKLAITFATTPTGETYHAKLSFGDAGEFIFDGKLDAAKSILTGRATGRADRSLIVNLAPDKLPDVTLSGAVDIVFNPNTSDLEATISGDLEAGDWGNYLPEFAVVDSFNGRLTAEVARRGGKLLVNQLDATLNGVTTPASARVTLTQPVDPLALPSTPLATVELTHWPVAWANPWMEDSDAAFAAGEFTGRWSAALVDENVLQLRTLQPATLTSLNVTAENLPPLPVFDFSFSPQLDLSAEQVVAVIDDFTATTAERDRLTARLRATLAIDSGDLETTGELRGDLPSVLSGADQPLPFVLDAHWDAALTGDELLVRTFEFNARRDADANPGFSVQLLRPLAANLEKLTAAASTSDAGDWLRVRFDELPLDWVTHWLDHLMPGYAFAGTFTGGESVLRPAADDGFEFTTIAPWRIGGTSLSIGGKEMLRGDLAFSPTVTAKGGLYTARLDELSLSDPAGNTLTGRIFSEATLAENRGRVVLDLTADLPALPYSEDTFGALTATLQAEAHNEYDTIAAMDALELRVRRGEDELFSVIAPEPFVFGLSKSHMFNLSTITPLRIKTGEIPLAWLRPFTERMEFEGALQPAEFLFASSLTHFQLRPLKPVQVSGLSVREGEKELVRDTELSFYPGLDLTFVMVTLPEFQMVYSGTAHVTDGTLHVQNQPAGNVDLALTFLGNDQTALPKSIELSTRAELAPLATIPALQEQGLPARGTLVARINGDLLGAAPLEAWARLEGISSADGQRILAPLEITTHGKVTATDVRRFDTDVSVWIGTTPHPTDAHFEASLDLQDINLHFASAFRSQFIDAVEMLAYAEAFQRTADSTPNADSPVVESNVAPKSNPPSKQLGTPFWSVVRGHFDLDIGAVQYAPYRIDGVKGRLDVGERELVLSQLNGEMFAGRWGGTLRVDYDGENKTADHQLTGDFHIHQFESARVVQTVFPNQVASVDAQINVNAAITSQGNSLFDLIDRAEGSFTVEGAQGVMRLTVPKQDMMATAVVFGGTVLLSPELRALGRLLRQFSEMPLEQLRISGQRAADGTVSLNEFRFDSPQARLLGHGRIPSVAGEPLMNRPLELSLELAAKDEVAVILGGMSLLEKKPRDDGYRSLKEKFVIGGKAGDPDTKPLYDLLAKAVSGSKGTWGFLMRKVQAQIEKMKTPPAKKTAALNP